MPRLVKQQPSLDFPKDIKDDSSPDVFISEHKTHQKDSMPSSPKNIRMHYQARALSNCRLFEFFSVTLSILTI